MLPPFDPWLSGIVAVDVAVASRAGADALAARRARRLADLLASAARGSRLYRRLLKGRDPAGLRLEDLPIMRKVDLMRQFDDWVTDPELRLDALRRFTADRSRIAEPFLGRYVVWESSGTSGEPGIFVQDASAMAVYDALEALRRPPLRPLQRLLDPWCLGERIVFVGATGGHFASTVSMERLRRLDPALSGSVHGISFLQPTHQLVAELRTLAPTIIATYPSAAVLLAEEHLAGRLEPAPREMWTGGETLTPAMRRFVQQAFGCPVTNSYGASESLSLASECHCGCLHLNSDWAILESVDDRGLALPVDEAGATTLLTNLANHLRPLLRPRRQRHAAFQGLRMRLPPACDRGAGTQRRHAATGHARCAGRAAAGFEHGAGRGCGPVRLPARAAGALRTAAAHRDARRGRQRRLVSRACGA